MAEWFDADDWLVGHAWGGTTSWTASDDVGLVLGHVADAAKQAAAGLQAFMRAWSSGPEWN